MIERITRTRHQLEAKCFQFSRSLPRVAYFLLGVAYCIFLCALSRSPLTYRRMSNNTYSWPTRIGIITILYTYTIVHPSISMENTLTSLQLFPWHPKTILFPVHPYTILFPVHPYTILFPVHPYIASAATLSNNTPHHRAGNNTYSWLTRTGIIYHVHIAASTLYM